MAATDVRTWEKQEADWGRLTWKKVFTGQLTRSGPLRGVTRCLVGSHDESTRGLGYNATIS